VDFAQFSGKNLTLRATNSWSDKAYEGMGDVMQFNVGQSVSSNNGNGAIPKEFSVNLKFPMGRISATREFKLVSHMDTMWGINSWHMDNALKRILMRPPLGTIEKYVFKSEGMTMKMGSGMNMSGMNMGHDNKASSSDKKKTDSNASHGMTGSQTNDMMEGSGISSGHNSHHGGSMMGMSRLLRRLSSQLNLMRRQNHDMGSGSMGSMGSMGGDSKSMDDMMSSNSMMNTENYWTHAMHMHLVVSYNETLEYLQCLTS
jgi:hypothetical protein